MGIFDLFKRERVQQSHTSFQNGGSVTGVNNLFSQLTSRFLNPSNSNILVSSEMSFQVAAYWLAVRAISEDVAKLPIKAHTLQKDGTKKNIETNPVLNALKYGFNEQMDAMTGRQLWVQWLLTYGNAYNEVIYNNAKTAVRLYPIHPSRVTPFRPNPKGPLHYKVTLSGQVGHNGKSKVLTPDEMFHLRGPGNEDVGYSIGEIAAQSLGITIAAQNFTGSFFGNNLSIGATLETDKALNAEQKEEIRGFWKKRFSGPNKAAEMAILDRGFKFNRIQMASTDAELLSTRKFQVEEIARWFRIPPHKLMDMTQAKFANLEQNDLNYITDTLTPWISRIETQLKFRFERENNLYFDIDEKNLARGDMQARTAYYKEMFAMGAINAETIANIEGLPNPTNGDEYYIPLNLAPVKENLECKQLDNQAKKKQLEGEPVQEMSPEEATQRATELQFQTLKGKFDAYGVAVRAGALTPQTSDEQSFRQEAGLPPMSTEVNGAWQEDGGVRRPITLQTPAQKEIEEAQAEKVDSPEPTEEPEEETTEQNGITEQAALTAYMPCMIDSLSRLTRKEQRSHDTASKKDAVSMKEHLDKFYIKFEQELADCLEIHAKYLTAVTSKEMFTSDKFLFMAKEICQWAKADNQAELISAYLIDEIAQVEDLPKLGEIRQDEDGNSFTYTMKGWIEVDVIKK